MPGWPIRKNEAGTLPVLIFPIYDADGDLVSAAASLDSERSIDQGTFTDCTNEAAEIATSSGWYSLAPTQAELNGDEIAFMTKTGTAGAKTACNAIYTSTRNIDDLAYPTVSGRSLDVTTTGEAGIDLDNNNGALGTADFDADFLTNALLADNVIAAEQLATDTITAAKIAANAIGASELATDAIGDAQIATGAIASTAFAAGAIDAAAIAADAIGASEIAVGAIAADAFAAGAIDAAAIGTGAIDADAIATDAIGAAELATDAVQEIQGAYATGTSDAGGSTTTMVDAARTEVDDVHIGNWIKFTSGAIADQVRLITDFVAATDTTTFAPPVTASVGAGFTYEILHAAAVDVQSWVGLVTALVTPNALVAGAVDADVSAMQANTITASAMAVGAIAADAFVAGAIDSAAIAAGAIGSSEIATDAIGAAQIAAAAITASEAPNLDAAMSTRATPAQVNTEVSDVMKTDTIAEQAQGAPPAAPTFEEAIGYLYMAIRNELTVTASTKSFKNDAGTVIWKKALTDDATTYTEAEGVTGP